PLPTPPLNTGDGWHTDFHKAFHHGHVIERPDETITIEVLSTGDLVLTHPSGLHVGDPIAAHTATALTLTLPPGRYPAQLSEVVIRARDGSAEATAIAASRIKLAEGRAVSWRFAGSFSTDDGIGAWMTDEAHEVLAQGGRDGARARIGLAASRDGLTNGLASSRYDGSGPQDVAWCLTGFGGGDYDVYVGLDADDRPVELVADFQVLLDPVEATGTIEDPYTEPPGIVSLPVLEDIGVTVRRAHDDETASLSGKPLWFEIDARQNRRDPRLGFPEVRGFAPDGQPVPLDVTNEGFRIQVALPAPGEPIPTRIEVAVRVGFEPM
ncbi:MAG: hypothetical protein D6798_06975, partial [Deltaproteobacteria bacterium]